ncbi:hypothetical protein M3J09_005005 [Ascochyta lentis]
MREGFRCTFQAHAPRRPQFEYEAASPMFSSSLVSETMHPCKHGWEDE